MVNSISTISNPLAHLGQACLAASTLLSPVTHAKNPVVEQTIDMRAPTELSSLLGAGPVSVDSEGYQQMLQAYDADFLTVDSLTSQQKNMDKIAAAAPHFDTANFCSTLIQYVFDLTENKDFALNVGYGLYKNTLDSGVSSPYDFGSMDTIVEEKGLMLSKSEVCQEKLTQARQIVSLLQEQGLLQIDSVIGTKPVIIDGFAGYGALSQAIGELMPQAHIIQVDAAPQSVGDAAFCKLDTSNYISGLFNSATLTSLVGKGGADLILSLAPVMDTPASFHEFAQTLKASLAPQGRFALAVPFNGLFFDLAAGVNKAIKNHHPKSGASEFLASLTKEFDVNIFSVTKKGYPAVHTPLIITGQKKMQC